MSIEFTPTGFKAPHSCPKVVILGAGPAGLSCAVEMIKKGYQPIILEKRSEELAGKAKVHPVILYEDTLNQLETHKIYSYLLDQHLIFPKSNHKCTVRLIDIEQGIKHSLGKFPIHYQHSLAQIIDTGGKIDLILTNGLVIKEVDLVVNAEGSHSTTNDLLGNRRSEVLGDLLAVYSILREDRPSVTNLSSFLEAGAKTARNFKQSVCDHTTYLAQLLFKGEHFFSSTKNIAIAATLKTPGQHRVGFAFTQEKANELRQLQEDVKAKKQPPEKLEQRLHYWTRMALCEVNVFSILEKVGKLCGVVKECLLLPASHLPIESANLVNIRSDRAQNAAIIRNKTLFLITGDALATVDPSAVLGCNTAIQLGLKIEKALEDLSEGKDLHQIAKDYTDVCNQWIERNHTIARNIRQKFTPVQA